MVKSKVVAAVGVSANTLAQGASAKKLAARIEEAMAKAIEDACADGLRVNEDAAEIRERMMAARARVLAEAMAPRDA